MSASSATSKFLDPSVLASLGPLSLVAQRVVEGYITGLHQSPWHGFNVEFSEHRSYQQGDEPRHIDWKLYGKSDKFFVKQYEADTNLRAYLVLDCSGSMQFDPSGLEDGCMKRGWWSPTLTGTKSEQFSTRVTKWRYAQMLTAALAYLLLHQRDSVGFVKINDQIRDWIPPRSTKSHLEIILENIERPVEGHRTQLRQCLTQLASRLARRGLIIIISDLWDFPDQVLQSLGTLVYHKHEVIVFHILDRQEEWLETNGDYRFVDLESGHSVIANTGQVRHAYQRAMQDFTDRIQSACGQHRVSYCRLVVGDDPLELALGAYLARRMVKH